jgi:hypothetical protein
VEGLFVVVKCNVCGKEFKTSLARIKIGRGKYCSRKCMFQSSDYRKNSSESHKGNYLSEEAKRKIGEANRGNHHTEEVKKQISESLKGEKSYRWKGGVTPENEVIRHSMEYRFWRREVFKRDDYTCQKCGVRGGVIRAHHIESFDNNPDKRTLLENGVTLCKECHRNFHHIYGSGNNTQEQLAKFLENKQKDLLFDK